MRWQWLLLIGITIVAGCTTHEPQKLDARQAMMQKLAHFKLDELGNPQIKSDYVHPVSSTPEAPHRLLIIPVGYADLGFDRYAGEPDAAEKNRQYLQKLLFAEDLLSPAPNTLSHYYYHQSKGQYSLTGTVLLPVTVDHTSEYYGKPIQNSDGQWRNDVRAETLVEDALRKAYAMNPDFAWQDFDVWDPEDYDNDHVFNEPDGYIDHFVLVFAGKGQSSCQRLYALDQKLTVNANADSYNSLSPAEQECAQRIWPHRFSLTKNNGKGPTINATANRRGGVPLTDNLWVYDYNMQSEYTSISTFIHEFGHSLGLPDIYARQTSNSTASWELMSSTVSPVPQELSTWSRMVLGWSKPCVVLPPEAGGSRQQQLLLKTMNDWQSNPQSTTCEAAMVVLPPKIRELRMGPPNNSQGQFAAYTGQGNSLDHFLERELDLTTVIDTPITLSFDTWFRIEADWDYLYVEVSDDGENYLRLMPTDKSSALDHQSIMPSKRGHDGLGTIPGFTGLSGDLNGDGKVETAAGCDPNVQQKLAEDQVADTEDNPCDRAQWVTATFDLSPFKGKKIALRFHYYADMAAVEDGALIDNIRIPAIGFADNFETGTLANWQVAGFSISDGSDDIVVPHFYLLEYRDPDEKFAKGSNYDNNINKPGFTFYPSATDGEMAAMDFRYRSGLLVWYYNGSYLWSQNDPSEFGPGNGFLLLVDAQPQEYLLPFIPEAYYKNTDGWRYYDFDAQVQTALKQGFIDIMCYQRRSTYYPVDMSSSDKAQCHSAQPPAEAIRYQGKPLMYSYTINNELLPGVDRDAVQSMGSLLDYRVRDGQLSYRLNDRMLRNVHSADAPFATAEFPDGIRYFTAVNGEMSTINVSAFPAVSQFDDSNPANYLNPHLPFGSAAIPSEGLNFHLEAIEKTEKTDAKMTVNIQWQDK